MRLEGWLFWSKLVTELRIVDIFFTADLYICHVISLFSIYIMINCIG
jgi:hypothetical protein